MPSPNFPPPLPLTLRSHFAVYPHGCEVERHDGFWVVRTPTNPGFFWGNFLHFDAAPTEGDAQRWPALFEAHVAARQPDTGHVTLLWGSPYAADGRDDGSGAAAGFKPLGYDHHPSVVMVASALEPAAPPAVDARLRRLDDDADDEALVEFHVRTRDACFSESGYRTHMRRRVDHWRRRAEAGGGACVGAWVRPTTAETEAERELAGDVLAAALGVFAESEPGPDGLKLARFQDVVTDARWRRRGLCSALLADAAACLAPLGVDRYVIVASEHDEARPVYAARGFAVAERWHLLLKM